VGAGTEVSPEEDDDDEQLVLDPSAFTVQDLVVTLDIPKVQLVQEAVFVVPAALRAASLPRHPGSGSASAAAAGLPHSLVIPVSAVVIKGIRGSATASNNPWVVRVSGGLGGFHVRMFSTAGQSTTDSTSTSTSSSSSGSSSSSSATPLGQLTSKTLFSLPAVTCAFHIVQTSTLGRYVSGGLDRSCFDVSGRVSMGPFTIAFNPRGVTTHASPVLAPSSSSSSSLNGGQGAQHTPEEAGRPQSIV